MKHVANVRVREMSSRIEFDAIYEGEALVLLNEAGEQMGEVKGQDIASYEFLEGGLAAAIAFAAARDRARAVIFTEHGAKATDPAATIAFARRFGIPLEVVRERLRGR